METVLRKHSMDVSSVVAMTRRSRKRTLEMFRHGSELESVTGTASTRSKERDEYPFAHGSSSSSSAQTETVESEPSRDAGALVRVTPGANAGQRPSQSLVKVMPRPSRPKAKWHPNFKLKTVISGHDGWVQSIAMDPGNEWFATGSADRRIRLWDLASGQLRLTLTGHIGDVQGLAVSSRHPYLFSVGADKTVKCWDLESNRVIRQYHGHLSGVHCVALHPVLDVLVTGGHDSVARVWDIRTKAEIFTLAGHSGTVFSVDAQGSEPQIITGSQDTTVRLWDLAAGRSFKTLTHHKKSVRSLKFSSIDYTFITGSWDNIKHWKCPDGEFIRNYLGGHHTVINALAMNEDGIVVSGGNNGTLFFWDATSGVSYQQIETIGQPGSLASDVGILAATFDRTGLRLITGEADKTVKIWMADPDSVPPL